MNNLEIFNLVRDGLIAQGRPSFINDAGQIMCRYRSPCGARCAVGLFIKDENYDPKFEGRISDSLPLEEFGIAPEQYELMSDLQSLHDSWARSGGPFPDEEFLKFRDNNFKMVQE